VSPEARVLSRRIDALVARARIAAALESAAIGAAVAAWSIPAGLAVAVIVAAVLSRDSSRAGVIRRVEKATPSLGNLIFTADEIHRSLLAARPHVVERVFHDATSAIEHIDVKTLSRPLRLAVLLLLAGTAWIAHAVVLSRSGTSPAGIERAHTNTTRSAAAPGRLEITVTIRPPAYTRLQSTTMVNPSEIRAVENSQLEFSIASDASDLALEMNGVRRTPQRDPGGRYLDRLDATRSGYAIVTAGETRRLIALTVVPDALPTVRIVAPGRDLIFASGNRRLTFEVRATDDYGLRAMSLRFTKVSGSGEQFEFSESEIPLQIERSGGVAWMGSAARALAEFGLSDGDMLVYRAVASDERPGAVEATSDAFFIQMSRLGAAAGDAFTLPEEETRYALSQQMLIVKTERLITSRGGVSADDFAESARGLAIEQRMIRSEFVFMLGGEIEDEAIEAEQSVELQEGRLANRGQRDLRAATVAMSQAEKHLTDVKPEDALAAERAAVAALQRAFARDRYILRSLATRTPLDSTRRLTGAVADALTWRRQLRHADDNQRARQLADLLQGLGAFSSEQDSSDSERRNRLFVLAGAAIKVDPESDGLRQAAASLQNLADAWPNLTAGERSRQLDVITNAIAEAARRSMADPPALIGDTAR
jgi:hypothetical protein